MGEDGVTHVDIEGGDLGENVDAEAVIDVPRRLSDAQRKILPGELFGEVNNDADVYGRLFGDATSGGPKRLATAFEDLGAAMENTPELLYRVPEYRDGLPAISPDDLKEHTLLSAIRMAILELEENPGVPKKDATPGMEENLKTYLSSAEEGLGEVHAIMNELRTSLPERPEDEGEEG